MIILELILVLAFLLIGARKGGIGLGIMGGLGLAVLVFAFGLTPQQPPIKVMLMIVAAVTAAATLQAAGGLDYMVQLAEKMLRKNPKRITFMGPLVVYIFTFAAGTGHIAYALLPIIADISKKTGIRPERPMSVSSVTAQLAITGSPISAAVVAFLAMLTDVAPDITLFDILIVTIPATLGGSMLAALVMSYWGKDLDKDPVFIEKMKDPKFRDYVDGGGTSTLTVSLNKSAKPAVITFILGVIVIVLFGSLKELRPSGAGMDKIIEIVMLSVAAIISFMKGTDLKDAVGGTVFKAGMTAVIAIFGIAWMSDTFFKGHMDVIKPAIEHIVSIAPWTFALALFTISVAVNSQAATTIMIMPLGIQLGIPVVVLIGILPSVYGYFFIPNYPIDIASTQFDRTGTTKIGKYLFNHSFMIPGLVGVISACCIGLVLSNVFL